MNFSSHMYSPSAARMSAIGVKIYSFTFPERSFPARFAIAQTTIFAMDVIPTAATEIAAQTLYKSTCSFMMNYASFAAGRLCCAAARC